MMTFNELKTIVYEIAQAKFGQLTPEINQRLDVELNAIEKYGRTEMLQTMRHLVEELRKHNISVTLTYGTGYNVSLIFYLLGISTFNSLCHPELKTESYAISAFESSSEIVFKIDKDQPEVIDRFLVSQKCEIERNYIPGGFHSMKVKASREGDSDFTLEFKYVCNSGRIRIIGDRIGWDRFEKIPTDDPDTMRLIHEIDLFGTTTSCLAPITIEAIRKIKPSNVSELTDAMSFTFEKKYGHLLIYIENRKTGNKIYTGYPEIDSILHSTHGTILYTSQMGQILILSMPSKSIYADIKETIKEKYRSLMASPISNKCDKYVEAYDLYRLAYIKLHHPVEFSKILTSK